MNRILRVLGQSSVGKKVVMAVTGLVLVVYLITHVLANLLVFDGPDRINALRRDPARAPGRRSGARGWCCSSRWCSTSSPRSSSRCRSRAARPVGVRRRTRAAGLDLRRRARSAGVAC